MRRGAAATALWEPRPDVSRQASDERRKTDGRGSPSTTKAARRPPSQDEQGKGGERPPEQDEERSRGMAKKQNENEPVEVRWNEEPLDVALERFRVGRKNG